LSVGKNSKLATPLLLWIYWSFDYKLF